MAVETLAVESSCSFLRERVFHVKYCYENALINVFWANGIRRAVFQDFFLNQ